MPRNGSRRGNQRNAPAEASRRIDLSPLKGYVGYAVRRAQMAVTHLDRGDEGRGRLYGSQRFCHFVLVRILPIRVDPLRFVHLTGAVPKNTLSLPRSRVSNAWHRENG